MRHLFLTVLALIPLSAFAGEEAYTIRVIQEDGSVDVLDLRQSAPASTSEPEPQAAPVPVKAPKAPPAKVEPKKKKVAAIPPPPPHPVKPPPLPLQRKAPQGTEINRTQAIAIALDYALPSSDVEVFRSEYKGQSVFAVIFKVESGYHEVLVAPRSGKVLESRKSDSLSSQTRPGHLPGGLR